MYILNLLFKDGGISIEGVFSVLAFVIALFVALVLHEVAHGYVAYLYGDNTAKACGRLSLNPAKHFNLMGLIMMLVVGIGWAKPVPVNSNNFKNKNAGKIAVSLAGVATNLLIAFVSAIFYAVVYKFSIQMDYYLAYFLLFLFQIVIILNVNFALFNILPLFPLDGYRLLACFVDENKTFMQVIRKYSLYILIAFMMLNVVAPMFSPLYWYIGKLGSVISNAMLGFWQLIIK